jgi:hypothetical protein
MPARSPNWRTRSALIGVVVLLLASTALVLEIGPAAPAAASPAGPAQLAPSTTSGICNPTHSLAPSSIYINQQEPLGKNLSPNGTLSSYLELQVLNYTPADYGLQLWFPSTYYTYPMATHGNFSYVIQPQFVTINGSGWLSPPALQKSAKVAAGIDFAHDGLARLTTQKLAIMVNAPYGNITVEFRWHWSMQEPNSTYVLSHSWTVPSNSSGSHGQLPSIFYPAPYVTYLGGTTGSVYIGDNFSATLGGAVAGRNFFLEMEYAGGKVQDSASDTAPANATTFNVSIIMLNYDHYLDPALVLVHIHDSCGALLYNKEVRVVFAPVATVQFFTNPATCGAVTINGATYTNGMTGSFTPSETPYNFTLSGCKGYTFSNWVDTGALHIVKNDVLLISGSGTFTVTFKT